MATEVQVTQWTLVQLWMERGSFKVKKVHVYFIVETIFTKIIRNDWEKICVLYIDCWKFVFLSKFSRKYGVGHFSLRLG